MSKTFVESDGIPMRAMGSTIHEQNQQDTDDWYAQEGIRTRERRIHTNVDEYRKNKRECALVSIKLKRFIYL